MGKAFLSNVDYNSKSSRGREGVRERESGERKIALFLSISPDFKLALGLSCFLFLPL
jgi:hypothetical protein